VGVVKESARQRAAFLHRGSQRFGRNGHAVTLNLNEGFVWRPTIAENHGDSGDTIAANQAHFKTSVPVFGYDGGKSMLQKVDVRNGLI
jgi:hypothetical protein